MNTILPTIPDDIDTPAAHEKLDTLLRQLDLMLAEVQAANRILGGAA